MSVMSLVLAWEQCQGRTHSEVAVRLLELADPPRTTQQIAALSIGERDRMLLTLRRNLFGPSLALRAECPSCHEQLELLATTEDFEQPFVAATDRHEIIDGDHVVSWRPPSSYDMALAMRSPTFTEQRDVLWARCVTYQRSGIHEAPAAIPESLAARLEVLIEKLDAQATCSLDLTCPECGFAWRADFDIVPVLWSELDGQVRRELHHVHRLATSYGWDEPTVLALSAQRRQFYLEQV
jgi:hypothetical protein